MSLILKDIVVLLSKFLIYPIICGSFMHNGLMTSLSLSPIKCLNEFFEPYGSSLGTNISLTSMSSYFLVFLKIPFFHFFVSEIHVLSIHSYTEWKKKKFFFYNNLGVQGVIIYFYGSSKQISIFRFLRSNGLIGLIKIAWCLFSSDK